MAGRAAQLRREFGAALGQSLIDRLVALLGRLLGIILCQRDHLVVLQVLDQIRHGFDLAHALTHQEQLVGDEKFRLTGKRGNVFELRIAVIAVARAAKLQALAE